MIKTWKNNLKSELNFWERWCASKGEKWPDDFNFRLNPDNELQEKYKPYIKQKSKIIDIGSGIYTILGRNLNGVRLDIVCIDPLAKEFERLRKKYNLPEIDVITENNAENLTIKGNKGQFDFVHAQNCIDHSYNPVDAFKNMVKICKPGGFVYTCHEINEGRNENYHGLHQWNFYENDGFYVSDKTGNATCISEIFKEHNQITEVNHGWITFTIQKKA